MQERRRLVMFRAGQGAPKVLPLSLVSRIEMVETSRIESSDGRLMVLLQGRLMPIVPVSPQSDLSRGSYPVLVVADEDRTLGLLTDEIVDIIEDKLEIQLSSSSSDLVGSAEIRGQAVELIDVSHFVRTVYPEPSKSTKVQRVALVAEDTMLRDLLTPMLTAAGYSVVASSLGDNFADLLAQNAACDAMIIDIDARQVAAMGLMRTLKARKGELRAPILGLSKSPNSRAQNLATDCGMAGLVGKHDRHSMLGTLACILDSAAEAKNLDMELAA